MAQLLDSVELVTDSGRWKAGRRGTVVEVVAEGVLVEIADGHGHTLDILSIPHGLFRASKGAPR